MSNTIEPLTYGPYDTQACAGAKLTEHKDGTVSIRMKQEDLRAMANSAAYGEQMFAKVFAEKSDPNMVLFNNACEKVWQEIFDVVNHMGRTWE